MTTLLWTALWMAAVAQPGPVDEGAAPLAGASYVCCTRACGNPQGICCVPSMRISTRFCSSTRSPPAATTIVGSMITRGTRRGAHRRGVFHVKGPK